MFDSCRGHSAEKPHLGRHRGVVVPFTAPAANGNSDGCTAATAALIDEIIANPAGFYVNVHTTEHPGGAMRAQLG